MATEDLLLTLCENGPILVPIGGEATIGDEVKAAPAQGRMALCRCGGTANPPFCDGSHNHNGFKAEAGTISCRHSTG